MRTLSRKRMLLPLVISAALLLAGCTSKTSEPVADGGLAPARLVFDDPKGLVGLWRVSEAAGESPDSWLRLSNSDLMVWTKCGAQQGAWRAAGGLFLASTFGGFNSHCPKNDIAPAPDWLTAATAYKSAANGEYDLLDRTGTVVAHLAANGHPPTSKHYADFFTVAPDPADGKRTATDVGPSLPSGAKVVSDITGRWVPPHWTGTTDPFLQIDKDGIWTSSDGCNHMSGRWLLGQAGLSIGTGGFTTMMACDGAGLSYFALATARVGMVGNELTFFDASGAKLGAVVRG